MKSLSLRGQIIPGGKKFRELNKKRESLTTENGLDARNERQNILTKVIKRITHQHHIHLVQKVVHLPIKDGKKKKHRHKKKSSYSSSKPDLKTDFDTVRFNVVLESENYK